MDTIWLTRRGRGFITLPEDIEWECGLCHAAGLNGYECEDAEHSINDSIGKGPSVARLAFDYPTWDLGFGTNTDFTVACLHKFRAAELLLVVGNPEAFDMDRDVMFVTLHERPDATRYVAEAEFVQGFAEDIDMSTRDVKWEYLASCVVEDLECFLEEELQNIKELKDRKYIDSLHFKLF
jgi:hypothetical protein